MTFMTSENTSSDSDDENSNVQNNQTSGEHLNNTDFTNEYGLEETLIQNFAMIKETMKNTLPTVGNGLLVQIQGQILDHSQDHDNYSWILNKHDQNTSSISYLMMTCHTLLKK